MELGIQSIYQDDSGEEGLYTLMRKAVQLVLQRTEIEKSYLSSMDSQQNIERRFAEVMGDMLIDGYWSNTAYAPGQDTVGRLLDELESLGLDEELEDPGEHTVILMEWGEQMAAALAPERLEIHIDRPLDAPAVTADGGLTSAGARTVTLVPVGAAWDSFDFTAGKR